MEARRKTMTAQTYATHRRWLPIWHAYAFPVSAANVAVQAARAYSYGGTGRWWDVAQAIAIMLAVYASRTMALRVQDRVIRLEMRLRLQELLGSAARETTARLQGSQLIGL